MWVEMYGMWITFPDLDKPKVMQKASTVYPQPVP